MEYDLSIIVVNYNTEHLLAEMFSAVEAATGDLTVQKIVIDNASRDGSVSLLRRTYPDVELIANQENVGFGRANNQAIPLVRGEFVLLLNTDAFVSPGGIERSVRFMRARPDCALLGVRLVGRDGSLQPSCRYFPTPWNEFLGRTGLARFFAGTRLVDDMSWDHASVRRCDWVPGCYLLIRKEVVDRIGLFDPRFFLYYEEVDLCMSLRKAGLQVMYFPDTTVVHIGGESAKSDAQLTANGRQISALQIESALLFHRKHHGLAGLLLGVALLALDDTVLYLKRLLRMKSSRATAVAFSESRATWSLLRRTAWGSGPTR
ncbi:MAG: glycosyltransferase family 2 protein [Caldimonas sp.]